LADTLPARHTGFVPILNRAATGGAALAQVCRGVKLAALPITVCPKANNISSDPDGTVSRSESATGRRRLARERACGQLKMSIAGSNLDALFAEARTAAD